MEGDINRSEAMMHVEEVDDVNLLRMWITNKNTFESSRGYAFGQMPYDQRSEG